MNSALGVSRFLYAFVAIVCIASTGCVSCTQPCLPSAGPSVGCGGGCGMISGAGSRLRGRVASARGSARNMLGHLGGGGSGCGCGGGGCGEVVSMDCGHGGCGGGANMCGSGGLLGNLGCGGGVTGGLIGGGCGVGGCGAGIGNEMAAKFGQMCEGGQCNRPYPPGMGAGGMPGAMTQYPYYTLRGPRDFLMANPPSIGP